MTARIGLRAAFRTSDRRRGCRCSARSRRSRACGRARGLLSARDWCRAGGSVMPASRAVASIAATMRRATPSPRASGAVHTRLTSPSSAPSRASAPQPTGRPSSRARKNHPCGGVIASASTGLPLAGSKPASKRRASSAKYAVEAPARVGRVRRLERDGDGAGAEQPLDLGHRRQQALALGRRERREDRARQFVRKPLVGGELGAALGGQRDAADPRVALPPDDFDQPLGRQRAQQAAEIAGIEAERGAQARARRRRRGRSRRAAAPRRAAGRG